MGPFLFMLDMFSLHDRLGLSTLFLELRRHVCMHVDASPLGFELHLASRRQGSIVLWQSIK